MKPGCRAAAMVWEETIWTDGSCIFNGRWPARASYAIYFGDNDRRNKSWDLCTKCTKSSSIAELCGVHAAMKYIQRHRRQNYGKVFTICTDSVYVLEWLYSRGPVSEKEDWIDVQNVEHIKPLYLLYSSLLRDGVKIELSWVRAHSGVYENNKVDKMAYWAAKLNTFVCYDCSQRKHRHRK